LKPTKPLPEGKKVKCPKCGRSFLAGEAADEQLVPPSAARPKPVPAKKKPVIEVMDVVDEVDEEDDEGADTYSVVKEPEDKVEEEAKDKKKEKKGDDKEKKGGKPKISYAPDTSVKDPRGPAQAEVVKPSNWMIITGSLGAIGYVVVVLMMLWPAIFSNKKSEEDKRKEEEKAQILEKQKAAQPEEDTFMLVSELGLMDPGTRVADGEGAGAWAALIGCILGAILGAAFCGLVAYGAVRMQNLEARQWAMASSIMAMIPITVGGFWVVTGTVAGLVFHLLVFDDKDAVWYALYAVAALEAIFAILIGVWNLRILLDEKVIEGYEYIPD
jgi:uncharacterized membrane protein YiaA